MNLFGGMNSQQKEDPKCLSPKKVEKQEVAL